MRIIDQLQVWFLTMMVGDVAVGAYSAARAVYLLIFSFFNLVETTLFPPVSEQAPTHPDRLRMVLGQARKYSLWLGLLVASLVTVTAPWLVRIIAGDEYLAAVPLPTLPTARRRRRRGWSPFRLTKAAAAAPHPLRYRRATPAIRYPSPQYGA
ncbi:MAG: hypothetical protein J7M39_13930 [Anaerolineae bacterium]|nr:hypothetical protein [Anaerolineae bacterium]